MPPELRDGRGRLGVDPPLEEAEILGIDPVEERG